MWILIKFLKIHTGLIVFFSKYSLLGISKFENLPLNMFKTRSRHCNPIFTENVPSTKCLVPIIWKKNSTSFKTLRIYNSKNKIINKPVLTCQMSSDFKFFSTYVPELTKVWEKNFRPEVTKKNQTVQITLDCDSNWDLGARMVWLDLIG